MKKILLFLLTMILLPINVSALEYSAVLTGKDYLYAKHENEALNSWTKTSLYIDITNFDNVGSFMMYVTLDNNLVGISGCNTFNFISSGCGVTSFDVDRKIVYEYKYNIGMDDDIPNNHFYTVTFQPKNSTPDSGTTEVVVTFEDAKDRDGNPITIKSAKKTYTFKEWKLVLNADSNDSLDNKAEDENKDSVVNDNVVDNNYDVRSNNNYISQIIVYGYKINFDKNKTDYEIIIDNNINELDIDIFLDDDNASYEIIGNNNLKDNNYIVLINVKAESGDIRTYKINTLIKDDENPSEVVDVSNLDSDEDNNVDKKLVMIGGIVIVLFLVVGIIISVVSHRNSKKINKMLDEL